MTELDPHAGSPPKRPAEGLTRSEEELVVTTELVQTGRARLIKRVETETVTRTIELRREVLEIQRFDDAIDGAESDSRSPGIQPEQRRDADMLQSGLLAAGSFQDGTVEIVLMQEEALITTQIVPRERVRLTKQIVTEERTIDADLTVERTDVDNAHSRRV